MHMPLAISICHLQDIITECLQKKYTDILLAVPPTEWIRLQFWPSNPFCSAALCYTGKFKVKHGVQVWQLRKDHPNAREYFKVCERLLCSA